MTWPSHIWDQLKSLTADDLVSALDRDGWTWDSGRGAQRTYRHSSGRRVSIHYHPRKTYQAKLLQALLTATEWQEADLRRLKLIR
jgi:predicted RNA binding protein YcfA (HicA-like mRNA interferase family)